jgi:CheY-like chemotaxis protein
MDSKVARIVYADDDDLVRGTLTELLTSADLDVRPCADGAEAIRLCEALMPHAALLDLNMPNVDGFEAAKLIRGDSRLSGIRLVAITGRGTWGGHAIGLWPRALMSS